MMTTQETAFFEAETEVEAVETQATVEVEAVETQATVEVEVVDEDERSYKRMRLDKGKT